MTPPQFLASIGDRRNSFLKEVEKQVDKMLATPDVKSMRGTGLLVNYGLYFLWEEMILALDVDFGWDSGKNMPFGKLIGCDIFDTLEEADLILNSEALLSKPETA